MRIKDWEVALDEYLVECASKEYKYGVHDCFKFVANAVKAQTGIDVMEKMKYKTLKKALGLIKGRNSRECASSVLGEPTGALYASQGDVVLLPEAFGNFEGVKTLDGREITKTSTDETGLQGLGVVAKDGIHVYHLAHMDGKAVMVVFPLKHCECAWKLEGLENV